MIRLLSLLLLTAACLLLTNCGNARAARTSPDATSPAEFGLPELASLPAVERHASGVDYQLLDSTPAVQSPTGVTWSPGSLSLQPAANKASFAIFGLGEMLANGRKVPITLKVTGSNGYYLALSDYNTMRWRFVPYKPSGTYGIPDGSNLISPTGETYVALIAHTPSGANQTNLSLTQLALTTNERTVPTQLELWFYLQTNLQVDQNLTNAIALLDQAQSAGYTKVLYADTKLEFIDLASPQYLANLAAFKAACEARGIEIIPNVMSPGYANGTLLHNPNLVEGQPVRNALFQVDNSLKADSVLNPNTRFLNGGFEQVNGHSFVSWNQIDGAGVSTFADAGRTGGTCVRFEDFTAGNPAGNDRITQSFFTDQWQVFSINFWVKTESVVPASQIWARVFSNDPEFRQMTFNTFPIGVFQDWTQYHLIFNSQEKQSFWLYLGIWGGQSGRFWIDDVEIEHAGLMNLIRRPGAPFTVTSEDGSITYTEGVDYNPVSDPNMGQLGYPGNYDLYHLRPKISFPPGAPLTKGDRFLVSYSHATFTDDLKPAVALNEEEVYDILADVVTVIDQQLDPQQIMLGIDEHRVAGWSEPDFSLNATSGTLLAAFTQRCDQVIRGVDPNLNVMAWSDMYDPQHNMVGDYYLARGGMLGTDSGLPATWDIANWNSFASLPSLSHFATKGNWQVLSAYYDQGAGFETGLNTWLDAAQPYVCTLANGGCVSGVMYTTWYGDYSQLDEFATAVRAWEAAQ